MDSWQKVLIMVMFVEVQFGAFLSSANECLRRTTMQFAGRSKTRGGGGAGGAVEVCGN